MADTYATADDVRVRLGKSLDPEEVTLVEIRLADVERMIRRRIPDLDDKVQEEDIDLADVVQVEADAVLRLVRNPDGLVSETDGNYSYMLRQDLVSGRLEILPEEWATLGVRRRMVQLVPSV
ncbi:Gp19/Gp15/Gp42 family protein [Mycolicibacter terrae]|uniref:Gp19/Gp15/Gp42 family protein n=1 Tax=Mycolicibacter terrae TaxID=1788 RepID=UPI002E254CD7